MAYITTKEASLKWGISPTRITILANAGRIPGAQCLGRTWLIPAEAPKPEQRKGGRGHAWADEMDTFSFPLYPFRPDWSKAKEKELTDQKTMLLNAEAALMECRFEEGYLLAKEILRDPEDIGAEIGALWTAGMCCVGLNRPDSFFRFYLRLQAILSQNFPHRDDYALALVFLKSYVDTIVAFAADDVCRTNAHEQCLPMACLQAGYRQLTNEAMETHSAEEALLELNLRFLENTSAIAATQMLHCHLMDIYSFRQNVTEAEKHAKAVVRIAYKKKLYFPLISYYSYSTRYIDSVLEQYPEEFRNLCHALNAQYEKNFTAFCASFSEDSIISKFTDADYPYIFGVMTGVTNAHIAKTHGISSQTVKRKLDKICDKLGVKNRRELQIFLRSNI